MSYLKLHNGAAPAAPAAGSVEYWTNTADGQLWYTNSAGNSYPVGKYPKDIEGRVFVDPANTQGWAGADAGAWINSAYAYIHTTYSDNNGGVIELAAGSYSYSTPIVLANAGLMSIILRGAGDGNGATILNYTAVSGAAVSIGGGSGNDGGVQLENFTITGTAQGNGATAVQIGVTGTAGVAGSTIKNVSIRRFTNGFNWATGSIAYAAVLINCKVQQCTNGLVPFGENNIMFGGLVGGCATGIVASAASEMNLFGVAFDDNTTTAINLSNTLARMTLSGCRFENAGLGTSVYITISAGSISMQGGAFQEDNTTGGPATGFVQATGGIVTLNGVWLYSGGRVLTQAFNIASPTEYQGNDIIIAPGASSPATTLAVMVPAAYRGAIIVTPTAFSTVETVIVSVPVPLNTLTVGTTYRVECYATISTSTAGTITGRIRMGTAGTIADAQVATVVDVAEATAVAVIHLGTLTVRTLGATGTVIGALFQFAGTVAATNATAPAAVTVNTTVTNFISFTLQGAGTASPTITVSNAFIELVRSN